MQGEIFFRTSAAMSKTAIFFRRSAEMAKIAIFFRRSAAMRIFKASAAMQKIANLKSAEFLNLLLTKAVAQLVIFYACVSFYPIPLNVQF